MIEETKIQRDKKEFHNREVRNDRVLIVEQFDSVVDMAEITTETYEIFKDSDLDDILNELWKIKDLAFDQKYLRNEISYISLRDKCS
jgi:hypothetical protein